MTTPVVALAALTAGALFGLLLGVPLGRRIERVAWHADAAITRARVTGWLIRDLAGWLFTAVVVVTIAGTTAWAFLTHRT